MPATYRPLETFVDGSPFQAGTHDVFEVDSTNASVKYRTPDCRAMVVIPAGSHVW